MATGNSKLIPVTGAGWSRGLNNVLNGELKGWFGTRKWWSRILIWAASVNLIFFIVALSTPKDRALDSTLLLFNIFVGLVGAIGASITMQSAVVGEKRSGTAAWVLSKPVSRTAFILAKFISNLVGIAVTLFLAQGLIAYLITGFLLSVWLPLPGFLAGLGVLLIHCLFYLTLTLLLGVIFDQGGPVIAIPLAFLFAQNILMSFYPPLAQFIPWTLAIPVNNDRFPSIAMQLMTGSNLPSLMPLYSTVAAIIIFVVLALWIFDRQEF